MSKQHEMQIIKEIDKVTLEMQILYLNAKIAAAHLEDGKLMEPIIDELERLVTYFKTDIAELADDIRNS